jgi:hypothetical protein
LLPDDPELPGRPDEPDDPEEPDDPDEPGEALRPDCPLLPEPDIPLEPPLLPEPDMPLEPLRLLEPDIPPELSRLPEDPMFWSRSCDELDELPLNPLERSEEELPDALRAPPCELDDPELPPTPPVLEPLDDACRSRSDAACPSPCDELPRSRFELADEALLLLWSLFDEPEVFRSRSAIYKSS